MLDIPEENELNIPKIIWQYMIQSMNNYVSPTKIVYNDLLFKQKRSPLAANKIRLIHYWHIAKFIGWDEIINTIEKFAPEVYGDGIIDEIKDFDNCFIYPNEYKDLIEEYKKYDTTGGIHKRLVQHCNFGDLINLPETILAIMKNPNVNDFQVYMSRKKGSAGKIIFMLSNGNTYEMRVDCQRDWVVWDGISMDISYWVCNTDIYPHENKIINVTGISKSIFINRINHYIQSMLEVTDPKTTYFKISE